MCKCAKGKREGFHFIYCLPMRNGVELRDKSMMEVAVSKFGVRSRWMDGSHFGLEIF
jgi:hypothetical protein